MKMQYFQGDNDCGLEPICVTPGIANGTAYSIGHLTVAGTCYGGPGPFFFSPWIYKYTTGGLKEWLKDFCKERFS